MKSNKMKIQKLPAETRSKFQSAVIVTDAVQCVLELVHNSLDAEATGIAVRIDLKSYQIRVIDNGKGIAKDDLEFVGERFMTSKYQSVFNNDGSFPTYGFKGQALSSLQEVSRFLVIETKSENEGPTFKKVFQSNKALPITESYDEKRGTGTTVTVEDFMYTMPVRRKRINEVFDLEEIKSQLQYLAVIHYNVCFTLRNENKGIILIQTSQASSILESLTNIYGKGLTQSLETLYYKEKKYEVTGFLSLRPQSHSNVQLLFLNKRIITKGVIHKFINNLTKQYRRKQTFLSNSPFHEITKSLKGSYNAYIIQIQCPHSYYELFTNLRKTTVEFRNWKDLLKCIHKAVKRTFRNFIYSDSLSSSLHHVEFKAPKGKEDQKTFGTSFLLNAIKGVPAKRSLPNKREGKKRKKMKIYENIENFEVSFPKTNDNPIDKSLLHSIETVAQQKDCTKDSLESPIPKKNLKSKTFCDSKHKKTESVDQSFREFYKWLKTKLEASPSAFNFYNDFLQLKNASVEARVAEFKSPVLGGKPKTKKVGKLKKKKLFENQKKFCNRFLADDEEVPIMTKRELKIYPSVQLRMQKAVQFSKLNNNISGSKNLNRITGGNLNSKEGNGQSVLDKSESLIASIKNWPLVDFSSPLPSSEVQFTNIIKFRNLPESFFRESSEAHCNIPVEKTCGCFASKSWESHYRNFISNNFEFFGERQSSKNYFCRPESEEKELLKENANLELDLYNICERKNETKAGGRLRHVEIQVNMSVISAEKVDAVVQTCGKGCEFPNFENSSRLNERSYIASGNKSEYDFRDLNKCSESNNTQGMSNPDFRITSARMNFEKSKPEITSKINDVTTKNLTHDILDGKNSTSSEFICGHKSHSFTKLQNETETKETQTFAAFWTDSLIELDYANEKLNQNIEIDFNLASINSENPEVPKTIPVQEIENIISQPSQYNFCLTERHEFVPKGLSPKFLYPETTKIFTLSPFEKWKLKLTIDDTQNESLANIKWQNNSTDDCLKPKIPDRILFEMRRKAGKSWMSFENPILSATVSYCALKVHNLLHSFAFTKELLSGVQILGQLDKKFIITKIQILAPKKMELISLFDQHAVDERIKLEELINENLLADGKLISSSINPPVECSLKKSDVRIVSDFQRKILNFGLNAKPVNENTIFVNEIPSFLLNKHEKNLKNKKEIPLSEAIKALITNIISEITETRGAVSKIPKVIYNAFCLEACHKAIKFNKALTTDDMSEMIQKLQNCKLPFQCAHGRPSIIPLIDLEDFNPLMEENETIDFQELKKFFNGRKH